MSCPDLTLTLMASALSSRPNSDPKACKVMPHQGQAGHRREVVIELLDDQWAHTKFSPHSHLDFDMVNKLTLRVLFFISRYRQIASYQGQPVAAMLDRRKVLLDPVGAASRVFLGAVSAMGLAR